MPGISGLEQLVRYAIPGYLFLLPWSLVLLFHAHQRFATGFSAAVFALFGIVAGYILHSVWLVLYNEVLRLRSKRYGPSRARGRDQVTQLHNWNLILTKHVDESVRKYDQRILYFLHSSSSSALGLALDAILILLILLALLLADRIGPVGTIALSVTVVLVLVVALPFLIASLRSWRDVNAFEREIVDAYPLYFPKL